MLHAEAHRAVAGRNGVGLTAEPRSADWTTMSMKKDPRAGGWQPRSPARPGPAVRHGHSTPACLAVPASGPSGTGSSPASPFVFVRRSPFFGVPTPPRPAAVVPSPLISPGWTRAVLHRGHTHCRAGTHAADGLPRPTRRGRGRPGQALRRVIPRKARTLWHLAGLDRGGTMAGMCAMPGDARRLAWPDCSPLLFAQGSAGPASPSPCPGGPFRFPCK